MRPAVAGDGAALWPVTTPRPLWHVTSWLVAPRVGRKMCLAETRIRVQLSMRVWGEVPRYLILTVTAIRIFVARDSWVQSHPDAADQICYDCYEVIIISKYQWHNVTTRNVRIGAIWKCQKYWPDLSAWAVLGARLLTSNYEYLVQRFIETLPPHMGHGHCILHS